MALPTTRSSGRGLGRFDLLEEFENLRREMDSLFGGRSLTGQTERGVWSPSIDIYEENGQMVVRADLPGVDREDIHVSVDNDILTISGERRHETQVDEDRFYHRESSYGRFVRRVGLPRGTDAGEIRAGHKNGVLEVRVPRSEEEEEAGPREVEVQAS